MRILHAIEYLLMLGGVSLLVYSGFVVEQSREFQRNENRALDELVIQGAAALPGEPPALLPHEASAPAPRVKQEPEAVRDLIGRVEIPRLGLNGIIVEGSDDRVLRRSIGHIPGTALPGERGNIVITGHRDTFFRPLRNIAENDLIRLTTAHGQYAYRVVSISVVTPDNDWVLKGNTGETLTLITCFPFSYIGPAPRRFVVRAERERF